MRRIYLTMPLLPISALAIAHEEVAENPGPWDGHVSLGYLATTGNSENTSASAFAEVSYTSGNWQHVVDASAIGAQAQKDTTAEAYQLGWQSNYSFNDTDYVFGLVRWQIDKFSGYDEQLSEAIGYGRRLINTDVHTLNGEIGVGARQSDLRDGTTQNETIALGALDYVWHISETSEFGQALRVESGSDNTYMQSVTALKANVLNTFALVLSYTIQSNSDVPAGSEKTDTFTAISLEYSF